MLYRLLPWIGRTYNDAHLAFRARITIAEDPLLADITLVSIRSVNGVIHLKGRVPHATDKAHIEGAIRIALRTADLPYARLVNAFQASAPRPPHRLADPPARLAQPRSVRCG